jgi:hypothetical protein
MSISKLAPAFPLLLGIACSTAGSQSSEHTGAMWPEKQGMMTDAGDTGGSSQQASQQATKPSPDPSKEGTGAGAASASPSETGSDASGTVIATAGPAGSSDTGSGSGGAMGSGGSSETMGSGSPSGGTGSTAGDTGASAGASGAAAAGAQDQGAQSLKGKVSKVSSKEVSITPKGGTAKTLKLSDLTVVTINGKEAKPSQLKQGQAVHASYTSQDGQDVATKIEVSSHHKKSASHGTSGSTGSGSSSGTSGSSGSGSSSGTSQ